MKLYKWDLIPRLLILKLVQICPPHLQAVPNITKSLRLNGIKMALRAHTSVGLLTKNYRNDKSYFKNINGCHCWKMRSVTPSGHEISRDSKKLEWPQSWIHSWEPAEEDSLDRCKKLRDSWALGLPPPWAQMAGKQLWVHSQTDMVSMTSEAEKCPWCLAAAKIPWECHITTVSWCPDHTTRHPVANIGHRYRV